MPKFVSCDHFYERRNVNEVKFADAANYISKITKPTYEIIYDNEHMLFMDIEYIPINDDKLIDRIIDEINEIYDIKPCAITKNEHSLHTGLSYHVYYSIMCTTRFNRQFVEHYISHSKIEHIDSYIDNSVYTRDRLFRVAGSGAAKAKESDVIHEDNKHVLIYGDIEDTIICGHDMYTYDMDDLKLYEEIKSIKVKKSTGKSGNDKQRTQRLEKLLGEHCNNQCKILDALKDVIIEQNKEQNNRMNDLLKLITLLIDVKH